MAFTLQLDDAACQALNNMMEQTGIKTKSKALVYLIYSFDRYQKLEEEYDKVIAENKVLNDVNFVRKIISKLEEKLVNNIHSCQKCSFPAQP